MITLYSLMVPIGHCVGLCRWHHPSRPWFVLN